MFISCIFSGRRPGVLSRSLEKTVVKNPKLDVVTFRIRLWETYNWIVGHYNTNQWERGGALGTEGEKSNWSKDEVNGDETDLKKKKSPNSDVCASSSAVVEWCLETTAHGCLFSLIYPFTDSKFYNDWRKTTRVKKLDIFWLITTKSYQHLDTEPSAVPWCKYEVSVLKSRKS